LEEEETKEAFFRLFMGLTRNQKLFLYPLPRGNFSAIHISTTESARPYADCEFAFKGAKDHMRWWFRKPAFLSGIVRINTLRSVFEDLSIRDDGEAVTDIRSVGDADRLCSFVDTLCR
jgi:hypothetical protein